MASFAVRFTSSDMHVETAIVSSVETELLAAIRATTGRYIVGDVEVWRLDETTRVWLSDVWKWRE